jgi:hypothetical protein
VTGGSAAARLAPGYYLCVAPGLHVLRQSRRTGFGVMRREKKSAIWHPAPGKSELLSNEDSPGQLEQLRHISRNRDGDGRDSAHFQGIQAVYLGSTAA